MTLATGSRLGPYEILAPIGAGGMGEVYRARDTRLAREVAIKVLPSELSSDASRLKRFEKEARSASSLNHPNVVTVYDIGSESGVCYIAMECVEGSTLRELMVKGPLPVRRMLMIAPQIAEGLAKAHEAGIVHRDLKPENVMLTKDGIVKILDFGLAKLTSAGSGSDEDSQLPTMTGTTPGVIVGTVGYMSPEQASGEPLDFRSDQFSLGSILYEMATGKRAFQKKTAIDTLGAILNEEPQSIASVNPQAPMPLRWIVERCLAKEPRQRYSSTDDLARDLATLRDRLAETVSGGALAAAAGAGAHRRRFALPVLGAIAGVVVLLAAGVFGDRWLTSRGIKTEVPSFHRLTFRRGNVLDARFAPDGRTIVYGASWEGVPSEVFTARTDSIESRPVGLSRADVLAVSSKGELAVLLKKTRLFRKGGGGTLARIPLGGGTPREILEQVYAADWAPNGEDLVVARRLPSGKAQIEYPIGTALGETGIAGEFSTLRLSPKGDLVAFIENVASENAAAITTIDRKGKRRVISRGWYRFYGELAWSPRGDELIFAGSRSEHDWAIRAVSLSGRERVLVSNALGFVFHDVAPDGRLLIERSASRDGIACQPRGENRERELAWLDGSMVQGISEDGKLVLFVEQGLEAADPKGIFLRKTDGTPPVRLGNGLVQGLSDDSRWVLNLLTGPPRELVMLPTGPGTAKKIPVEGVEPLWAWLLPNGKGFLVFVKGKGDSVTLSVLGPDGGKPKPVRTEGRGICVSPDGDRFVSVAGEGQLKIVPLSGGESTTVSGAPLERNEFPVQWSADSRFLYVVRIGEIPARVDRLELATGRREPWKQLMPEDSAGIIGIGPVVIARDGQSYAYSYVRQLASDLYVVEGLR